MEIFQNMLMPAVTAAVIIFGLIKKLPVFDIFLKGAKKALTQTGNLLPSLTALFLAVKMLESSGGIKLLTAILSPVSKLFGIPDEVLPLCIISPFSGSGSFAVLESILTEFHPDSFVGRTASVIAGASETTFYAVAVYYGSVGITKTRHTIPAALTADIVSFIAASFFCR